MSKLFVFLIFFTLWTYSRAIYREKQREIYPKRFALRTFAIPFNLLDDHKYKLHQKFDKELAKQRMKIKNDLALRNWIYETNLLRFQGSTNVLRDFHTNRF
jgi:hypothetical protein